MLATFLELLVRRLVLVLVDGGDTRGVEESKSIVFSRRFVPAVLSDNSGSCGGDNGVGEITATEGAERED